MKRREFLIASGALLAACTHRRPQAPLGIRQRGIAFDPYLGKPDATDFRSMRDYGATHLALFTFGYMKAYQDPLVRRYLGPGTDWSLTDDGLLEIGRMARAEGLELVVLPTLADFYDGHWRGEAEMTSEEDWTSWFGSYRDFVLHYARLGRRMGASGISVGTELRKTVHRPEWPRLIADTRAEFPGWLTYAANWDDYESVPWWRLVDFIGIQAYFELGSPATTDPLARQVEQLEHAWEPIKQEIRRLAVDTGKRVIFTEIGYKSHTDATAHPWDWTVRGDVDYRIQEAAYEAAFRALWRERWFAGFYWWKWKPRSGPFRDRARNFSPQRKPAAEVVRKWYRTR